MVEINLLGTPEIIRDGVPVVIRRNKAIGLIAYLADTGRRPRREEIADLLWPEQDTAHAKGALRTTIAEMRAVLGTDVLGIDADQLFLEVGAYSLDVLVFRAALENAQTLERKLDAIRLWRGDFLAGLTLNDCTRFTDWQFLETENLQRSYRTLLKDVTVLLLDESRPEEAIEYARLYAESDPFDEPACRELMCLYADMGNRNGALMVYRRYEQRLDKEFSLPPEESIRELAELIRTRKPRASTLPRKPVAFRFPRVAVLPFHTFDEAGSDSDLLETIEESLIDFLSNVRKIEVISRTSSLRYRQSEKTVPAIAAALRVDFLVESFCRRIADGWSIHLRLVDAARDAISESFETRVTGEDLAGECERLAAPLIRFFREHAIGSSPEEIRPPGTIQPGNPGAGGGADRGLPWRLRGRSLMRMDSAESFEQALVAFRRAVSIDGDDANAWGGIAATLFTLCSTGWWKRDHSETLPEVENAIAEALCRNPNEPTALRVRALVALRNRWDYDSAERDLALALREAPDDPDVRVAYAEFLAARLRLAEAWKEITSTCRVNPADFSVLSMMYWISLALGNYRSAMDSVNEIAALFPHSFFPDWGRCLIFNLTGRPEETIALGERSIERMLDSPSAPVSHLLASAYAMVGRVADAESILKRLIELSAGASGFRVPIAAVYTALNRPDDALDWLEDAADHHDDGLVFLSLVPVYRPLYDLPRYKTLLQRIHLPSRE